MAYDLITGRTSTDWSRSGHGMLGTPLAYAERAARREAVAFRNDLLHRGARTLGAVAFFAGLIALGYNYLKSKKQSRSDGWDW